MRRAEFSELSKVGVAWTMHELCEMAELVDEGEAKFGVKKKPWWPFIPLTNYVVPLLHVLISTGNGILGSFRDWVNDKIKCLNKQEIRTRCAVVTAEHKIVDLVAKHDGWMASAAGKKMTSLQGLFTEEKTR